METDAPYLAPVPKRGKRNEPALMVHTAAKLAALRGIQSKSWQPPRPRISRTVPDAKLRNPWRLASSGESLTAREILELVQQDLKRVEQAISLESVASVEAVTTIGQYLQAGGGKRLRPILVLLAARLAGGINDSAIRMAAVVEMIHTATLVHDDVIDIAKTRRGRPSSMSFGATTSACWPATGSTCRPSRWPCASATSMSSIC